MQCGQKQYLIMFFTIDMLIKNKRMMERKTETVIDWEKNKPSVILVSFT